MALQCQAWKSPSIWKDVGRAVLTASPETAGSIGRTVVYATRQQPPSHFAILWLALSTLFKHKPASPLSTLPICKAIKSRSKNVSFQSWKEHNTLRILTPFLMSLFFLQSSHSDTREASSYFTTCNFTPSAWHQFWAFQFLPINSFLLLVSFR